MATYTDAQLKKINYLRSSLRLQDPAVETDPAYQFTDDDLYGILEVVTPAYNASQTIDTLPSAEFYFVVLLAKKEVYYRLATSTAPFYPLSAEGAKLEKNVRFDHYLALIKAIMEEYEALTGTDSSDGGNDLLVDGVVQTYNQTLYGKPYLKRYAELSENPIIELELSGITETSVNLDWTKYFSNHGADFHRYAIFYGTSPVYDEYAVNPIDPKLSPNYVVEDVRRTKLRIDGLTPDTEYFFLVKVESRLGISGFSQQSAKTLQSVVTP